MSDSDTSYCLNQDLQDYRIYRTTEVRATVGISLHNKFDILHRIWYNLSKLQNCRFLKGTKMVNALNLAATLRGIHDDSEKPGSLFFELEIVPGDIFQIDESMLKTLCNELQHGVGLTECRQTDVLPYGRSRAAKIKGGCLSTTIEVPKGLKLGRRSFASTDDVIRATKAGLIQDFSIGLVDVRCECNFCGTLLSSEYEKCCEHQPGQKIGDTEEIATYTIKAGKALTVSAESFRVTDYENLQQLFQDWQLIREVQTEILEELVEIATTRSIKQKIVPFLDQVVFTRSHSRYP